MNTITTTHPIPAPLSSFNHRPFDPAKDIPAVVDLLNHCTEFDQLDHHTSIAQIEQNLSRLAPGCQRFWELWTTAEADIIGIGFLFLPELEPNEPTNSVYLSFNVHPDWRDRGLAAQILTWLETTAAHHRPSDRPLAYHQWLRATLTQKEQWLHHQGYISARRFNTLERSLQTPIAPPKFPPDYHIRAVQPDDDPVAWVEMFNQTFIDHWNHHPMTVEQFHYHLTDPEYRADLDWLAIAPDGTFAAFCIGGIDALENELKQEQVGWVNCLGTRRGYRRLGLARALLLQQLHLLQQMGMETARLGVDSENPNQAYDLYESVGFRLKKSAIVLIKTVTNPPQSDLK